MEVWLNSAAIGIFEERRVAVLRNGETVTVEAEAILICTGGAENALNFPGWTLPGVMGAGAAQTMVNVNHVLPGKNVLMVGSGNVGVIVTYQLLRRCKRGWNRGGGPQNRRIWGSCRKSEEGGSAILSESYDLPSRKGKSG